MGTLWKLKLAAYGLTESGRLRCLPSNDLSVNSHGLTRSEVDYNLYFFCHINQPLKFITAVQIDDYLYSGAKTEIKSFEDPPGFTFDVSKFGRGSLELIGGKITRNQDGSIKLLQEDMLRAMHENSLLEAAGPKGDRETN